MRAYPFPKVQAQRDVRPSRLATTPPACVYGWNWGPKAWQSSALLDLGLDSGATIFRGGTWDWHTFENADGTFGFSSGSLMGAYLDRMATATPKRIIVGVGGYSPRRTPRGTITVTADVAASTDALPVLTIPVDSTAALDPSVDFLNAGDGSALSRTSASYGSLIDSLTPTSVTLASRLTQPLTAGTKLAVTRIKYPPLNSPDPDDITAKAFLRYLLGMAHEADERDLWALFGILNEPVYSFDRHSARKAFYDSDTVPEDIDYTKASGAYVSAALRAGAARMFPDEALVYNGTSDKKAIGSMLLNPDVLPYVSDDGIEFGVPVESRHPYSESPEGGLWLPGRATARPDAWDQLQPDFSSSNAPKHAFALAQRRATGKPTPQYWMTECGAQAVPSTATERHATYIARRLFSSWGAQVVPMLYCIQSVNGDGSLGLYSVVNLDGTPRPGYYAAKRSAGVIDALGPGSIGAAVMPRIVGWQENDADTSQALAAVGIYGGRGSAVTAWQAKVEPSTGSTYLTSAPPAARGLTLAIPADRQIVEVTDIATGADLRGTGLSRVGGRLTVPIQDRPVVVRVAGP